MNNFKKILNLRLKIVERKNNDFIINYMKMLERKNNIKTVNYMQTLDRKNNDFIIDYMKMLERKNNIKTANYITNLMTCFATGAFMPSIFILYYNNSILCISINNM
jgi:actin-related protein